MNLEEARHRLAIDRNSLDDAISDNPELLYQVGHGRTLAVARRESTKDDLRQMDAALFVQYKNEMDADSKRRTDSTVKSMIVMDQEHVAAQVAFARADLEAAEWENLYAAFRDRSFSLRNLVDLYTANYFEKASHVGGRADYEDQQNEARRQRMNDKRKQQQHSRPSIHNED